MIKNFPTQEGQHHGLAVPRNSPQAARFVRFAVYFSLLDTGLRRYDSLMDYLG
jgi:hypothetical protein